MKTIGLTGGVGMGKSACADLLRTRRIPVIDTDELARHLVEPGQPALARIESAFGKDIVASDGTLRRAELARRVFTDPAARQRLENILHPRIRELWRAQVQNWQVEARRLAVVVIPLLFETGADKELDASICVACSAATQQQRLQARGWSIDEIQQRLAAQLPIGKKIAASSFVIWTEGDMELHAAQLDRILNHLNQDTENGTGKT
jgi:dephospho-CoA kinase